MIKKILIGIGILLAGLLGYVAILPGEYSIQREIEINARAEAIFPYLVNPQKTNTWMPWKDMDPKMTLSYSGPNEGVGAISRWESPGRMGVGEAEVIEVAPNQRVRMKITYTKPMAFTQISEFLLTSRGVTSTVSWKVEGTNSFLGRLMCTVTFMNMDKYVGGQFEAGLVKLKSAAEGAPGAH